MPPVLSYQRDGDRGWRRWMLRRIVPATIFLLLMALLLAYRRPINRRYQLLYWQYRCSTYTPPAESPVFQEAPSTKVMVGGVPIYNLGAVKDADCLPWRQLCTHAGVWDGGFFVGRLRRPDGVERLVAIDGGGRQAGAHELMSIILELGSLRSDPRAISEHGLGDRYRLLAGESWLVSLPGDTLTLYTPRIDAQDRSHFTMRYKFGEKSGVVHGWLQNDDRIKLGIPKELSRPEAQQL